MKKRITQVLIFFGVLLFASNGWCLYLIDGTDVGGVDYYTGNYTTTLGSPSSEELWVNSILDPDTEWTIKNEGVAYQQVYVNSDGTGMTSSTYAFQFIGLAPEYYLIKNANYVALVDNEAFFNWGVFDADDFPSVMNLGTTGFTISHVTRFGEASAPVPEPATMLLLGAGLLGMIGVRRKMKK